MNTEVQSFAQKAFILQGASLLVVRKAISDPHNPGKWDVPGGRMNFGEGVDEHLRREVLEEVGLCVEPGRPFHIWQWVMEAPGRTTQVVAVARECTASSFAVTSDRRDPSDHLDEEAWIDLATLADLDFIPSLRPAVLAFLEARI